MQLRKVWIAPKTGWLIRLLITIWNLRLANKKIQERLDIASGKNAKFHSSDDVDALINKFKVWVLLYRLMKPLEDLKSIGDYIAQENVNAAYNVLIRIKVLPIIYRATPKLVALAVCLVRARYWWVIIRTSLPTNNWQRYPHIGCRAYILKIAW